MTRLFLAAGASVLALAACQPAASDQDNDTVNMAQDAASGPVGATSASTMGANTVEGFVSGAAMGDMYEIQAAAIAMERSQNAQVRELAQMIATDHTAASQAMAPLAQAAGQAIPTALDQRRMGLLDNLRGADADGFDRIYLDQQIAAHNEALMMLRGFADNTEHPELAAHAQATIAPVERHLAHAEDLRRGMDGM